MKRLMSISLAVFLALGLSIVPLADQPTMASGTIINVPTLAYPTIQAGPCLDCWVGQRGHIDNRPTCHSRLICQRDNAQA